MSDGTIHSIASFMLQGSTTTPCSLTLVVLDLMLKLEIMDRFVTCVQRMAPTCWTHQVH